MQITTNGIVIREKMLNDDNRILTILTDHYGVIQAYVKTVKRLNSRVAASTELLSYSNFVLFAYKERYTVDRADSIKLFFQLRMDLEKLALSSYFSELMVELAPESENTEEYLRFFLNSLYMLEENKRSADFMKPVFELRLLTMAGYMPDLIACHVCGDFSGDKVYFLPRQGCLCCSACWESGMQQYKIEISETHLSAMRHIIYAKMETVFQFKMSSQGLKYLGWVCEQFVYAQLEKRFQSLEFYNSLRSLGTEDKTQGK